MTNRYRDNFNGPAVATNALPSVAGGSPVRTPEVNIGPFTPLLFDQLGLYVTANDALSGEGHLYNNVDDAHATYVSGPQLTLLPGMPYLTVVCEGVRGWDSGGARALPLVADSTNPVVFLFGLLTASGTTQTQVFVRLCNCTSGITFDTDSGLYPHSTAPAGPAVVLSSSNRYNGTGGSAIPGYWVTSLNGIFDPAVDSIDMQLRVVSTGVGYTGGPGVYLDIAVNGGAYQNVAQIDFASSAGDFVFTGFNANRFVGLSAFVINPGTVPDFVGVPLTGYASLSVAFTDLSYPDPTAWLWDFGDGHTSTLQNPTNVYAVPNVYTVSLTATIAGSPYNNTKVGYITVLAPAPSPPPGPSPSPAPGPSPSGSHAPSVLPTLSLQRLIDVEATFD